MPIPRRHSNCTHVVRHETSFADSSGREAEDPGPPRNVGPNSLIGRNSRAVCILVSVVGQLSSSNSSREAQLFQPEPPPPQKITGVGAIDRLVVVCPYRYMSQPIDGLVPRELPCAGIPTMIIRWITMTGSGLSGVSNKKVDGVIELKAARSNSKLSRKSRYEVLLDQDKYLTTR